MFMLIYTLHILVSENFSTSLTRLLFLSQAVTFYKVGV